MTALVIDHSLGTQGRSLEMASRDLDDVLRHVADQSQTLGVDPGRICIMAFAGSAALTTPLVRDPRGARCLALQYPLINLFQLERFSPWAIETEPVRRRFSIGDVLPTTPMPTLLIAARRDLPATRAAVDSLRARLRSGSKVAVLEHPDGAPGFERTLDGERTRDVVRQTLCFLQTQTGATRTLC
jgi:dienelactone hydrolase